MLLLFFYLFGPAGVRINMPVVTSRSFFDIVSYFYLVFMFMNTTLLNILIIAMFYFILKLWMKYSNSTFKTGSKPNYPSLQLDLVRML
jgi:hypothetical protein